MPGHLEELLRPRGGIPCSAAADQHQHHLWHLVSPLQPIEEIVFRTMKNILSPAIKAKNQNLMRTTTYLPKASSSQYFFHSNPFHLPNTNTL